MEDSEKKKGKSTLKYLIQTRHKTPTGQISAPLDVAGKEVARHAQQGAHKACPPGETHGKPGNTSHDQCSQKATFCLVWTQKRAPVAVIPPVIEGRIPPGAAQVRHKRGSKIDEPQEKKNFEVKEHDMNPTIEQRGAAAFSKPQAPGSLRMTTNEQDRDGGAIVLDHALWHKNLSTIGRHFCRVEEMRARVQRSRCTYFATTVCGGRMNGRDWRETGGGDGWYMWRLEGVPSSR